VPELRHHLGLPERSDSEVGAPEAPAAERRSERLHLFGAVHACLRSLARRGPVLLCLEDLHAADAASLLLIHYLARQTRRLPLVLVGTFRPEEAAAGQPLGQLVTALARERLAERLPLGPLDRQDSARLVTTLLDGPVNERLSESLYAATEGNPLFIEQLVLALREEGRLERRDGPWRQTGELSLSIPRIIREVIGQRLERLTPRCRETLEIAAVLGHAVEHSVLLSALQPKEEADVLKDLEEALDAQLLHETANGYVFGHAMLRETVYRTLSAPRRMRLHARVGETLEGLAGAGAAARAAELAHHFARAGQDRVVREKALRYSLEAGRRAAALSSHREALTHFSRACELIEQVGNGVDPATRLAALEGRGYAERELAMWLPCIASFRSVLDLTDQPPRRAWARATIGYALHHTIDAAAALAECDAGLLELARVADEPDVAVARLRLQASKVIPLFLQGRYKELLGLGRQMVQIAADLDQPRPLAWAHNAVALAHMAQGQVEPGIEHFQRNLEAAERVDDKVLMAIAHENLGLQYYRGGRFDAARAHLDRALALFRDSAAGHRAVMSLQALGRLWLAEGDMERAREQAELGLTLAEEAQDRFAGDCYDLLGATHALRAEWEAAEAGYQKALQIRERVGHVAGQADALVGLGLVQQRRGAWPSALESYSRAVEIASAMDPGPHLLAARRHLARLLWLMGETTAAGEELGRALALAEGISFEYAPTLLVLAEFRCGLDNLPEAISYAERALAAGMTAELTVEGHVLLATLHQMAERPGAASPNVAEALRLAERVGAPRLIGLAHLAAGRVAAAVMDYAAASRSFGAALSHLEAARAPYERALVLRAYAVALAAQGQAERTHSMPEEALGLFRQLGARPAGNRAQALLDELGITRARRV
jgi:tetratricopeptide (TPR) repeat protein